MELIRIRDHVLRASSFEDGQVIFRLVMDALDRGQDVSVSFDGILSVPSGFINAGFVQLVEHVPLDVVKARVRFVDSTKSINALLKSRIEFAARHVMPASRPDGAHPT